MSDGHTIERLKELQALPLGRKVGFTIARITEWYTRYNGNIYVSFSGGKDSTVLLYIARKIFPDIKGVFIDTGLEYPEVKDFVKTWDNIDIVKPDKTFLQTIKEYGYPVISKEVSQSIYEGRRCPSGVQASRFVSGSKKERSYDGRFSMVRHKPLYDSSIKISNKCCDIMKKKPAKKYEKETGLHPIIATMAEESVLRRSEWLKDGCNAFNSKRPTSKPMSFWTEQDVLQYIELMNIPIASVYGSIVNIEGKLRTTGCARTGCMFCMFGVHLEKEPNRFQKMYYTHPKQWLYCLSTLGIKQVLDFIDVPYIPKFDLLNTSNGYEKNLRRSIMTNFTEMTRQCVECGTIFDIDDPDTRLMGETVWCPECGRAMNADPDGFFMDGFQVEDMYKIEETYIEGYFSSDLDGSWNGEYQEAKGEPINVWSDVPRRIKKSKCVARQTKKRKAKYRTYSVPNPAIEQAINENQKLFEGEETPRGYLRGRAKLYKGKRGENIIDADHQPTTNSSPLSYRSITREQSVSAPSEVRTKRKQYEDK